MLCVNIDVKNAQTQLEVEFGQSDQCAPLSPILWQHSFAFCEACVLKYSGTMSAMSDGHRFPNGVWLERSRKYLQPATILRPSVWECILHHTKHQFWIHSVLARGSHDALRVSALARWQAWSPLKRFPARTTELARNLQGAEKTHEVLSVFFASGGSEF